MISTFGLAPFLDLLLLVTGRPNMCSVSNAPCADLTIANRSTSQVVKLVDDVLKGRKNWKRTKGDAEPIWPPELEKALIEGERLWFTTPISPPIGAILARLLGLQQYVPVDSRETRLLGRFPLRNRFLSEYIFKTTGKIRSAKQVGSRLQQLRDPRVGKESMR